MKKIILIMILIQCITSCNKKVFSPDLLLGHIEEQVKCMLHETEKQNAIPRSADKTGEIQWIREYLDWTEGFWPGICWFLYQYSGDTLWKGAALFSQEKIINHRFDRSTHDLGFIFNNSFGKAYRITGKEEYKNILIEAANSLISRYNPVIGCIKSWDWAPDRWQFPVIIDNMMNLELLFEVFLITGDTLYKEVAIRHANTTMKNHFRSDFSSFHVVNYDTITGDVIRKQTQQGFSDSSSWARGQSWGLYGYILCFRYTKDSIYLDQAEKIAGYILNLLPSDGIPYWDYLAPDSLKIYHDASAASILASALIELTEYTNNSIYISTADRILKTLSNCEYFNSSQKNNYFVLSHSVGSYPENSEVDVPIIYADYYFIEALMRLRTFPDVNKR